MKCCCGKKCTIYYFCIIKIKFLWFLFLDFFGEVGYGKPGLCTASYVVAGARLMPSLGGEAVPGSAASALIMAVLENRTDFSCSGPCASGLPPGITVPSSLLK